MTSPKPKASRLWLGLLILFGLCASVIVTASAFYYRRLTDQFHDAAVRQLTSIAELRVEELASWRKERMGDASFYQNNRAFGELVQDYLEHPGNPVRGRALQTWLQETQASHDYELVLLDAGGKPALLLPAGQEPLCEEEKAAVAKAMRDGKAAFVDLYLCGTKARPRFAVLFPLHVPDEPDRLLGVVIWRMKPEVYLYPLLQHWPVPSSTAETLLVRREGDHVVYLGNLRADPAAALSRRMPLTQTEAVAVKALSGAEGVVEGLDYRGARVLASLHPVPGSPWFLIAKIDVAEIEGPLMTRFLEICAIAASLLLVAGGAAMLLWRRRTRKQLEKRLRTAELMHASEERLRLAIHAANQGLYDLNVQTGEATVSPEYATMLGYDPKTFHETNAAWIERLHPDDRDRTAQAYRDYVDGRSGEYRVEFRQRTQNGEWKWILSVGRLMEWTPDGRPLRMLGTHTDISERKASEAKILRLTQLYAALSHCSQSIVRSTNEADLFAELCRAAVDFGGMKMAWIGMLDQQTRKVRLLACHGESTDFLQGIDISADENIPSGRGPSGVAIRENRPVWCQDFMNDPMTAHWHERAARFQMRSSASLPLLRDGRPVGTFTLYGGEVDAFDDEARRLLVEMAQDISFALDNFAKEAIRKKTEAQLHLLYTALQSTPSSWVITDTNGVIEWVNVGFTKLTGYTADEAIGQSTRILRSGLHSADFYRGLWETVKRGEVWSGDMHNRRKDGTLYEEQTTIAPVRDDHGEITHFVAMKYDVTETKKIEKRLLRAQRMEGIGMLAGGIAHDLNNVLAPILLSVELLKMRFPDVAAHVIITAIESAARRGAGVVRQVLTFARGIDGDRTPIRVKDIIREMVEMIQETFPRNIQIRQSMAKDLPLILGDATQIHQVLLNLAVNARDAMPAGGVLTIRTELAQVDESTSAYMDTIKSGAYVKVSVCDTGCGIPPEIIGRVFEPFFTTKEQGKGTGLGLSTVFGIVRSHGGFVDVKSGLGAGTEFHVYLPALPATAEPVAPSIHSHPTHGNGQTVLICDDEAIIRDVTGQILAFSGFKVIEASNGAEALKIVEDQDAVVALVIMDVMMPGMTGDKVAVEIRKRSPGLPILFSTGMVGDADMEASLKKQLLLPATAILTKPYQERTLLDAIDRLLKGQVVPSNSPFPH